jgi:hypothetical protein
VIFPRRGFPPAAPRHPKRGNSRAYLATEKAVRNS